MPIEFPGNEPEYNAQNLTLRFAAVVDGARVPCAISVEALEDHFGADRGTLDVWLRAFAAGRAMIEAVARQHLALSPDRAVLLKSGHFPPGSALTGYRKTPIYARPV
jgi:hypothetical protein